MDQGITYGDQRSLIEHPGGDRGKKHTLSHHLIGVEQVQIDRQEFLVVDQDRLWRKGVMNIHESYFRISTAIKRIPRSDRGIPW
jgi:hypothetical protein